MTIEILIDAWAGDRLPDDLERLFEMKCLAFRSGRDTQKAIDELTDEVPPSLIDVMIQEHNLLVDLYEAIEAKMRAVAAVA